MYMMGSNEYFMGLNDTPATDKKDTATDLAVAIPAATANLMTAYAMMKAKPQKINVQAAPTQQYQPRDTGLSTWEWVAIGVGVAAVVGAGSYFISQRRKG